jgi:hypothetical protein
MKRKDNDVNPEGFTFEELTDYFGTTKQNIHWVLQNSVRSLWQAGPVSQQLGITPIEFLLLKAANPKRAGNLRNLSYAKRNNPSFRFRKQGNMYQEVKSGK